jgi:hypothetical protein
MDGMAGRQLDAHEARSGDEDDIAISQMRARRASYASLRGCIRIHDDFDELPDDIADAFGAR